MYEGAKFSYARYLGGNRYEMLLRRAGPGTELLGYYNGYLSKDGRIMRCYCRVPAMGVWRRLIPGKAEVPVHELRCEPSYR